MTSDRCPAMTSTPFRVIVQCEFAVHLDPQHHAHVWTPMGQVGVAWQDDREGPGGLA